MSDAVCNLIICRGRQAYVWGQGHCHLQELKGPPGLLLVMAPMSQHSDADCLQEIWGPAPGV